MKIPKEVTPAKSAANKKNAEKSPGPKSLRGKFFASRNAVTHAIFAKDMLVPGESQCQLEQLRSETISSRSPVGADEILQVGIIIVTTWRLGRLYPAEVGEIAKSLAEYESPDVATAAHLAVYNQAAKDLTKLDEIEAQIDSNADVNTESVNWLRALPYGEPVQAFVDMIKLAQVAVCAVQRPTSVDNPTNFEEQGEREFARNMLQSTLDSLKEAIRAVQARHSDRVVQRAVAEYRAAQVPQEAVLDRHARYEKQLLNNLYRAEYALERMQRLRRGEKVPPPTARVG